ncbi:MAG: MCE family protein [Frankiales bacterium]|nr:MCE family protein [Frankiales bacterium]
MNRTRLLAAVVGLAVVGGVAGCGSLTGGPDQKTLTAMFSRAVGVYVASDVRILGVRIGEVTAIVPEGDTVKVEMTYDAKYDIPAEAQALVVAPSIVSDRYVQLTPTYAGGATLANGATLPVARTRVPVELDEIYSSLDKLNVALGPKGANKDGAVSDLIKVGAKNLDGNGQLINTTLADFSTLVKRLSDQRGDLFGTVANLQEFTTTLANRDTTVRAFNRDLAAVAKQLEAERGDLATAVKQLSVALGEVATFVRDNKTDLTANVKDLASVTGVLVKQRQALQEFIDVAPTALSNLQLAYNPGSGTLDTRDNNEGQTQSNPTGLLCQLLVSIGQPQKMCKELAGSLPPPPGSAAAVAPATVSPAAPTAPARDMSLGGILDGGR